VSVKTFEDSDFVVTFTGEAPSSRLIRTFDRVLAYLDYECTNRSPEESWRNPDSGIHDRDAWTDLAGIYVDDGGDDRHQFRADIGEIDHVTVTRLTYPVNEEWCDDQAGNLGG
jgi:hypothetical protein